jgi:alanine racemase
MSDSKKMIRPLWIEVNLRALRKNYKAIMNHVGSGVKAIVTIKQAAYGHGLIPVAKEFSRLGVDFFGVGSLEEAISLREEKFKEPILVLSATFKTFADYFFNYNIRPTITEPGFARELNKRGAKRNKVLPVHVKIDTGMGRLGLDYKDAHKFIKQLAKFKNISLEGIFTHFPVADSDPEFTKRQIKIFNEFILKLKKEGVTFKYQHCANSAGLLRYSDSHFNMVRPGLMLYGVKVDPKAKMKIEPALALKSKIIFLKKVNKNSGVSYGRTYITKKPTLIATVAAGYADGYPWALSGCGKVIIKDSLFNIAGRVCMDHLMVDLGQRSDIRVGQEVILIGKTKTTCLKAEDLAKAAKTIPYEIISRLSLKIPRYYIS